MSASYINLAYRQATKRVCLLAMDYYLKYKPTRNDPSAGSPTDALLRLLFPLDHTVRLSFHR